jgi:2'-hydroxyisoflavone reductase
MDLLVIGGTRFLGRHLVEGALAREHRVTLFHRGETNPGLFADAEELLGDRDGGLAALEGRRWDAVVDTCGYVPRVVRASATTLACSAGHYTFVSSLSVHPDGTPAGYDETAPVGVIDDPDNEVIDERTYGPLKALCESEVERSFPERALIVRPGLIVGPHDPTDRFTYWPRRVAHGGEVLAPEPRDYGVQVIDVRDLAGWILTMTEAGRTGVFGAAGPREPLTMEGVLEACVRVSGSDATLTWVDQAFLLDAGVEPWSEVPLWIPIAGYEGFMAADVRRAIGAGLTFRPAEETIRDTLAWDATLAPDREVKAGLTPDREAELLRAWRDRGDPPADDRTRDDG